jgi:hypothetical protein
MSPDVVEPKVNDVDDEDSMETKKNDDEYTLGASLLLTFVCPRFMR